MSCFIVTFIMLNIEMATRHRDEYKYHRLSLWVQLVAMLASHVMKIYQFMNMIRCLFSD